MLGLRVVLGLLIAGQTGLGIALWRHLPASIPTHFDAAGQPDGWGAPDFEWFVLSAVFAVIGAVTGYLLPLLFRRWAARNSSLLNVPDRERFRALPEAARVRAIRSVDPWLVAIGAELQLLTAFLLMGTLRVARGEWEGLPLTVLYGALVALLGTAIGMAVTSTRAVRRELAAAR